MIELPEAITLSAQLKNHAVGKEVLKVYPPTSEHKFCWFKGDAEKYDDMLKGKTLKSAKGFGIFAEAVFDDGMKLCINDGVNMRLLSPDQNRPAKYQLLIDFSDGYSLLFTVAMYGGIICHDGSYDDEYYQKSKDSISPLDDGFDKPYFESLLSAAKPTVGAKAFLATEQRIPGLGNGVLQDILYKACVNPRKKVNSMTSSDLDTLFDSVKTTLKAMTDRGGRDTEKDLFGRPGGYKTLMSKLSRPDGCKICGEKITKEFYLGGSVYYCPYCQPKDKNR